MARIETIETDVKFCGSCHKWTTHTVSSILIVCCVCGRQTRKEVIQPLRWKDASGSATDGA